jgi:hypothetical protein
VAEKAAAQPGRIEFGIFRAWLRQQFENGRAAFGRTPIGFVPELVSFRRLCGTARLRFFCH